MGGGKGDFGSLVFLSFVGGTRVFVRSGWMDGWDSCGFLFLGETMETVSQVILQNEKLGVW